MSNESQCLEVTTHTFWLPVRRIELPPGTKSQLQNGLYCSVKQDSRELLLTPYWDTEPATFKTGDLILCALLSENYAIWILQPTNNGFERIGVLDLYDISYHVLDQYGRLRRASTNEKEDLREHFCADSEVFVMKQETFYLR